VAAEGPHPWAASKGTKRSIKCNKKGPKRHPQWVAITTSSGNDDNDKEANNSDEEHIVVTNHFKKVLDVTLPHHAYPVRHKLKECSMMKNCMTTGA
jgi:hypothetical protein